MIAVHDQCVPVKGSLNSCVCIKPEQTGTPDLADQRQARHFDCEPDFELIS